MQNLATILSGLISGALTVPIVNWILNQVGDVDKTVKRRLAVVLSFGLGTLAFVTAGYFGYIALPSLTVQGWLEALWPVWAAAFTASQILLSELKGLSKG